MSESKKTRYIDENEPSSVGNSGSDSDIGVGGGNNGGGESSSAESGSDSDSEFDEIDVDRRRRICVRKMLELEKQFGEMKENLYTEKMSNFEIQLYEVREETAPEYNKRLAALQENYRTTDKILDILKEFQLNELKILCDSENMAARLDFENDKQILFDRLKSDIETNIVELQNEKRNADLNFEVWQRENRRQSTTSTTTATTTTLNLQQRTNFEATNSSSTGFSSTKRNGSPTNFASGEKRRKSIAVSGPYIVYMLKSNEILEDWNIIQRAIMQADLRDWINR